MSAALMLNVHNREATVPPAPPSPTYASGGAAPPAPPSAARQPRASVAPAVRGAPAHRPSGGRQLGQRRVAGAFCPPALDVAGCCQMVRGLPGAGGAAAHKTALARIAKLKVAKPAAIAALAALFRKRLFFTNFARIAAYVVACDDDDDSLVRTFQTLGRREWRGADFNLGQSVKAREFRVALLTVALLHAAKASNYRFGPDALNCADFMVRKQTDELATSFCAQIAAMRQLCKTVFAAGVPESAFVRCS